MSGNKVIRFSMLAGFLAVAGASAEYTGAIDIIPPSQEDVAFLLLTDCNTLGCITVTTEDEIFTSTTGIPGVLPSVSSLTDFSKRTMGMSGMGLSFKIPFDKASTEEKNAIIDDHKLGCTLSKIVMDSNLNLSSQYKIATFFGAANPAELAIDRASKFYQNHCADGKKPFAPTTHEFAA